MSIYLRGMAARAVLLSIFLVGCLFMGAPLVNAQAEEATTTDERLENIENLLAELSDNLENIHESYVTREILGYEMYSLKTELSALDSTVSTELSSLRIEMSALKSTIDADIKSVNKSVDMIWQIQLVVLAAVLGTYVAPSLADTYKRLRA